MFGWLQRWFLRREPTSEPLPEDTPLGADPQPPPWVDELLGLMQKSARTRAWLGLRLDDIERKLEGGFANLRETLRQSTEAESVRLGWDDLLDAMDFLEEAIQTASSQGDAAMADGLRGILVRLERFLAQAELERLGLPGMPPDGKLFRVVGTEYMPELAEGVITRVVRAAVLRGDRVVREGAVLTNRPAPGRPATPRHME
jgi:molecular chaperone GrpE (heat shock protein)